MLGSVSFVTFALVAIPDHIGHVDAESTTDGLRLGAALARTQATTASPNDWSGDTTNTAAATPSPNLRSTPSSPATQNADGSFPKRGFSPPLERAEPPPAPVPPPQPLQLNVPPPVPAPPPPAAEAPPPPQQQPEVVPQAAPAPAPPDASPPSAGQAPVAAAPAN
ncbi:MAG: hypothetical protein ABUL60_32165 [Myxococcales bacterium]